MISWKRILILFLFLGSLLRLWDLGRYPPGLTPDEAAQGYTAYSILKTGRDEWGQRFPLVLRSFGDFKPPLQTYLMVPLIAVLGLTEQAVRLPNALLGTLGILGVFLLAGELFASLSIGLLSATLLAFSPWHIQLSRGAFEANLTVFFVSFGAYFLLKSLRKRRWYWQILAAVFLGLNLFSYHSAKLVTPTFVLLFFFYYALSLSQSSKENGCHSDSDKYWKKDLANRASALKDLFRKKALFTIIFSLFSITAYSSFLTGGQRRAMDVAIFNPTDSWGSVSDERWWARGAGLPDLVARTFHNKLTYSLSQLNKNYLSYFSPEFLFTSGPGEGTYGMIPGRGVLWWWELPVLFFGLYWLIKNSSRKILLVVFLIFLSPVPAALAKGTRAGNRAAVMMPWIQIFIAWSIYQMKIKKKRWLRKRLFHWLGISGALIVLAAFLLFFLEDYFVQSPRKIAPAMLYGRCEALRLVDNYYPDVAQVVVSRKLSEPQAYVAFCLRYSPRLVQQEAVSWLKYQKGGAVFLDQMGEYRLGKYVFKEISWPDDSYRKNAVLIGLPEEFPLKVDFAKVINYPNGKPAIDIYKTSGNET